MLSRILGQDKSDSLWTVLSPPQILGLTDPQLGDGQAGVCYRAVQGLVSQAAVQINKVWLELQ